MTFQTSNITYKTDILGQDFECTTLQLPSDYEGTVVATLVRKKARIPTTKAVLYIHGFIDYFFQTEMAEQFNAHGYDFYALDLRKYGRSHLEHQNFYNVRQLSEYDEEITRSLEIIGQENHDSILLCGHSTGGLITTLYATHNPNHPLIKALWVNSPFYDFNKAPSEKKLGIPGLSKLARLYPDILFPSGLNKWYVPSLHKSLRGEWDFSLEWKKEKYPYVRISFIRAIHKAQNEIHKGVYLSIPALIMHSHQTTYPKYWGKDVKTSDIILDVKDIDKYANKMIGDITVKSIKDGLHDLVLSAQPVRETVYEELFKWLEQKM